MLDYLPLKNSTCPNCGAEVTGEENCPYCGTLLLPIAEMTSGKPSIVSIEIDGDVYTMNLFLSDVKVERHCDTTTFYSDNSPYYTFTGNSDTYVTLEGRLVPFEAHGHKTMYMKKAKDERRGA